MDDDRTEPISPPPTGTDDGPRWLTPNARTDELPRPEPPRRRTGTVVGIVGLVLLLAAGAAFFLLRSGGGEAVALEYSLQEGSQQQYRMTVTMGGTITLGQQDVPMDSTITSTVTHEVLSVDEEGVATVELRIEDIEAELPFGGTPSIPDPEPVRMLVYPDGRVETEQGVTIGGTGAGGFLPGANQFSALLPDEPVEPGDTWTKTVEVAVPFGDGETVTYETENEFLRYEDVAGVEAAVIRTSTEVPMDMEISFGDLGGLIGGGGLPPLLADVSMSLSGTVQSQHTSWFDPEAGEQLRFEMEGDFDIQMRFEDAPPQVQSLFGDGLAWDGTMTLELEPTG